MIENSNIFDTNEFSFLHEITNTLSSSLNLQESLSAIFELFNTKFGFMKAILTILDPSTGRLKIKVSYGLNPDDIETSNFQKMGSNNIKSFRFKKAFNYSTFRS